MSKVDHRNKMFPKEWIPSIEFNLLYIHFINDPIFIVYTLY